MIDWTLNIKLVSPNVCEHWSARHKRSKTIKRIITCQWIKDSPDIKLPVKVIITRIGPRKFDDDNLIASIKSLRDHLADKIIPGLNPGQADSSDMIKWQYKQEKGKVKKVRIQIEHDPIYDPITF